jgi:hypothetical protein
MGREVAILASVSLAIVTRWSRSRGLRWSAWAAVIGLLAFHLQLLVERLADGSLGHPVVAFQWATGLILLAWLSWLRRRGVSLVSGRRALAFWVLVLLLHAVPAMPGAGHALQADGGPVLLVVPLGLAVAGAAALLAWLHRRQMRPALAAARRGLPGRPARARRGSRRSRVPRGPPA